VLDTVEAIMGRLESGEDDEVEWMGSLTETISETEAILESGDYSKLSDHPEEDEKAIIAAAIAAEDEADAKAAPQPAAAAAAAPTPVSAQAVPVETTAVPIPEAPPQPRVLAQPIKPAPPGELRTQPQRRPRKAKAAKAPAPEPAPEPAPSKGLFAVTDTFPCLTLSDGILAQEGESLFTEAEEFRGNGTRGIIFDLRQIGFISSLEIRLLERFHRSWGDGLALVLSEGECPDLYRVFEVLKVLKTYKFYPEEAAAKAALGAAAS
jgi:anti-anti-sigma regulatory factor